MQEDNFQFTAAAASAATAVANTVKFVADYLISNHCQNNKNHLISKNTAIIQLQLQQLLRIRFTLLYYILLSKKQ